MKQQTKFKQTEIRKIPDDWEVVKLGEYVNIRTGKLDSNYAEEDGKYPFFTCAPKPLRIDDYAFNCEAILLAGNNANGIFHINYYNGKFNAYQRTYIITINNTNKINLNYLYYQLHLSLNMLKHFSQGTSTKFLTMTILNNLEILLPPIREQERISTILSHMNDKIELNNQMNKTLEAIGRALFKKWFIDESKKEWKEAKLGDYANIIKGVSYRSGELKESSKALVTLKSMNRGGGLNKEGFKEYVGEYKKEQEIVDGDIVVAYTDLTQKAEVIGKPAIVRKISKYDTIIASLDLAIIRPKDKKFNNAFLYYLLSSEDFQNHVKGFTNGTTVLHLSSNAVPNYIFSFPEDKLVFNFGKIIQPLLDKRRDNEAETEILIKIRDSLLPKLMSGEIRLK